VFGVLGRASAAIPGRVPILESILRVRIAIEALFVYQLVVLAVFTHWWIHGGSN